MEMSPDYVVLFGHNWNLIIFGSKFQYQWINQEVFFFEKTVVPEIHEY